MQRKDNIMNLILGIIVIGWLILLTVNSMGRWIARRSPTHDTLYLPPVGESTILEDYQRGMETLRNQNPAAANRLEQIMDSIHRSK